MSVCHSFFADIIFCAKTLTENKTELLEQSRFASMVAPESRMQCPVLIFKLLRDREQIPEKA